MIKLMDEVTEFVELFMSSHSTYHYLCYVVADMFLEKVIFIQRWYRGRRFKRSLRLCIHKNKYADCIRDIFDYGMIPPVHDVPLLRKGGHLYREGKLEFETYLSLI